MSIAKPIVIVVSGAAPYLGGAETWRPLRQAAPDIDFIAIDPMEYVDAPNLDVALQAGIRIHLSTAAAIVAHLNADRAVVELVARERPSLPVVLISPLATFANAMRLRIASAILRRSPIGGVLVILARTKLRTLRASRERVVRSLSLLVAASSLDDRLIDEAVARMHDDRTTRAVERTADLLREMLRPLRSEARMGRTFAVIVGSSPIDRRTARHPGVTVVPGAVAAAMIEAPGTVAAVLRDAIGLDRPPAS